MLGVIPTDNNNKYCGFLLGLHSYSGQSRRFGRCSNSSLNLSCQRASALGKHDQIFLLWQKPRPSSPIHQPQFTNKSICAILAQHIEVLQKRLDQSPHRLNLITVLEFIKKSFVETAYHVKQLFSNP